MKCCGAKCTILPRVYFFVSRLHTKSMQRQKINKVSLTGSLEQLIMVELLFLSSLTSCCTQLFLCCLTERKTNKRWIPTFDKLPLGSYFWHPLLAFKSPHNLFILGSYSCNKGGNPQQLDRSWIHIDEIRWVPRTSTNMASVPIRPVSTVPNADFGACFWFLSRLKNCIYTTLMTPSSQQLIQQLIGYLPSIYILAFSAFFRCLSLSRIKL